MPDELGTIDRILAPASWKRADRHLHTLLNSPWYRVLHDVTADLHRATHSFFEANGARFSCVPVTTTSVSSPMGLGSDSLPVRATINGGQVYLADSLQFLLELTLRIRHGPVYYVSTSFRGEDVDATHLSEFSHAEVEIFGDLDDIISLGSRYVDHLSRALLDEQGDSIAAIAGGTAHLEAVAARGGDYPRIRFDEAWRRFGHEPGYFDEVAPGILSITRKGEHRLIREAEGPVWITHMPRMACPFYQKPEAGTEYCLSADLLLGPGEILGAGERCRSHDETMASLTRHQVDANAYRWYLDMKKATPAQTAGFGLGIERFLMWVLGATDIRDCTPWLRRCGEVIDP
ncbi:asparagine synthetase A [Tistrella sp. BH-R2-4]|uniref:Asparagine synthetase A n=1 Tax=Tistrella arctica TaxID=3133430 RepID=A0ABU9YLT9_9PROT